MRYLMATFLFLMTAALVASAEVQVIDGKRVECKDGVCVLVEEKEGLIPPSGEDTASPSSKVPRIAQGYMSAEEFVAFLENRSAKSPFAETGLWLTLLLVLLGGLAMNLTPCVLPMIPINLIVIGRSAKRGTAYGLGMAVAYGTLGFAAAFGGLAFGGIQGNPWFNAAVAVIFAGLALALFDVFFIDLSRFRNIRRFDDSTIRRFSFFFPFLMGAVSAVLAGACVAPVLISVLLLTTDWVAAGHRTAVLLPFVMGLGMALPWPFLGAGLKVLPKPGAWMKQVNRLFGLIVVGFAVWYGWLAWQGFQRGRGVLTAAEQGGSVLSDAVGTSRPRIEATPSTLNSGLLTLEVLAKPLSSGEARTPPLRRCGVSPHHDGGFASASLNSKSAQPILVDCWATWCKNCAAMDRVMEEPKVKRALEAYRIIRVQAEDISELRKVKGFESIRGLPAFVIFD